MDGLVVFPGSEELPTRLADHPVAERADRLAGDRHVGEVEELQLGRRLAEHLLDHLHRVRALHLEAVVLAAPVGSQRRALVELDRHVVAARLGVVRHPVERRCAPDEVVGVLGQGEQDHIADDVALGRAGDEVLGLAGREAVEAVDAEPGEQGQRVGAFHGELRHVERLVEEDAGLLPRLLLVSPVRELGRHAG